VPQPTSAKVASLVKEVAPSYPGLKLVVLFGSVARDRPLPHSDVDLAIDGAGVDPLALAAALSRLLGREVDIVPLRDATIPLLEKLVSQGIVVFEGERHAGAAWRSRALAQLETDRPWYRRMRDAWLARVAREGLGVGR
jgi:predicted nucleotidyltransferase